MNTKYLPSKQFIVRLGTLLVLVGVLFGLYKLSIYFKNRPKASLATQKNVLVKDIVQKDSNGNGIADWEETLWGLDPTKDGQGNKDIIQAKKATLNQSTTASTKDITTPTSLSSTQNDALSAEFFTLIMSLQDSGDINSSSIKSISDALGKTIVPDPIADTYTAKMQIVVANPTKSQTLDYFKGFKVLLDTYTAKKMGQELTFITQGIQNKDPKALQYAVGIAQAYHDFARDLMKLKVPSTIAPVALSMANDYEKIGQSIEGMSQILQDPIIGMRSLISYKQYDDAAAADIEKLPDNI
jgi:hypothetical protein